MTWEYRGLQGVTGGYKGLQGVTRGYRGLQGVTKGYRGLQGVTGGFDENHGLSPLHKYQFCLLFKSMFIFSRKACFFNENITKYFFRLYLA